MWPMQGMGTHESEEASGVTHQYLPDPGARDRPEGEPMCTCGLPKRNRVHDVPELPAEVNEIEARRLGEAGE